MKTETLITDPNIKQTLYQRITDPVTGKSYDVSASSGGHQIEVRVRPKLAKKTRDVILASFCLDIYDGKCHLIIDDVDEGLIDSDPKQLVTLFEDTL